MGKNELIAKKSLFEAKLQEIIVYDYHEEIEKELLAYKDTLVKKFDEEKKANINKVNNYLELLTELIEEERNKEAVVQDEAVKEVSTASTIE